MIRAFFAVPIVDEDIQSLLDTICPLKEQFNDEALRWIDPSLLHITIRFLGNTDADKLARLAQTADRCVRSIMPFTITVKKIAGFPTPRSRILAAHIRPHKDLKHMLTSLDTTAAELHLGKDNRRFRPHITVGKFTSNHLHYAPILPTELTLQVKELVLYESKPTRAGSEYIALQRFAFMS